VGGGGVTFGIKHDDGTDLATSFTVAAIADLGVQVYPTVYVGLSGLASTPIRQILISGRSDITETIGFWPLERTSEVYVGSRALEHDPEKWVPVFPRDKRGTRLRGDHAQTKR